MNARTIFTLPYHLSVLATAITLALTVPVASANSTLDLEPRELSRDITINNGEELTYSAISGDQNINWDDLHSMKVNDGGLVVDGKDISIDAQAYIGTMQTGNGTVELKNGANWTFSNSSGLTLGSFNSNEGQGHLLINSGSTFSGQGTIFVNAGSIQVNGEGSTLSTNRAMIGVHGTGSASITNGGKFFAKSDIVIGAASAGNPAGLGTVLVDGENSTLRAVNGIIVGSTVSPAESSGSGILTVSNGATASSDNFIILASDPGNTGVLNIGGAQGEVAQHAGIIDTPRIHLGNTASDRTAILNFNHLSQEFTLSADITGAGKVNHTGSGTTTLTGANTWRGETRITNGTLRAGAEYTFSAASDYTLGKLGTLDLNGYSQVLKSLDLADGTMSLSTTDLSKTFSPTVLTIDGNYSSNNGLLVLRTALADDGAATDSLVVKGDTSGYTRVRVNNVGGSGAQTVEGISIIDVAGYSGGIFEKDGRIVAGAYDYDIVKLDDQNWYLSSKLSPVPDMNEKHQYRPEYGSYMANILAANTMFFTGLDDRSSKGWYVDELTGELHSTSLWMRNSGKHTRFTDGSGQLKTQANQYVVQLGGDIAQWSTNNRDRWLLGLMAGYGNSKNRTHSSVNGYSSRGKVDGYSAGLYGTWHENEASREGAFADIWVLYNWFDNTVTGKGLVSEKYDSEGVTASIATGYSFLLGESHEGRSRYWLQPKMQLTWMDVQADNHIESNGTRVRGNSNGNLQTRLGVKAYLNSHSSIDDSTLREFSPYIEANWIHNTEDFSVKMDDVNNDISGVRNAGELKVGLDARLSSNTEAWGNISQQVGDHGYSELQGMLGLKYKF